MHVKPASRAEYSTSATPVSSSSDRPGCRVGRRRTREGAAPRTDRLVEPVQIVEECVHPLG
jgi:hypothetical protein